MPAPTSRRVLLSLVLSLALIAVLLGGPAGCEPDLVAPPDACTGDACAPIGDASNDAPDGGCSKTFGDPTQPIQLVAGQFKNEQSFEVLTDSTTLDLRFPTQGGQVAYVGARVTNILACDVQIQAELFDIASGHQIAKEVRSVSLVPSTAMAGYGEPEPDNTANFSNLPMCPNYTNLTVLDTDTRLVVTVLERFTGQGGVPQVSRMASQTVTVRPTCNESGSTDADAHRLLCLCECQPAYCLGRCSNPAQGPTACPGADGGPADGGADAGDLAGDGTGAGDGSTAPDGAAP